MKKPAAPWPLLQIAIEPKSRADQQKLDIALSKLADEALFFHVESDEESGKTVIGGMGEVDLETIIDRLRRDFRVDANVGAMRVAYRETITDTQEHDYTHRKQSGGAGQFARVKIVFEPDPDSSEFKFESKIVGDAVPAAYVVGVEKGLRDVASSGPFAGFPMIAMKATLLDGAYHDVDSSVLAFAIAGRSCLHEAAPRLGVQLLEPIMKVEVVIPGDFVGNVIVEINGRRGQIRGQEPRGVAVVLNATMPLANMFKLEDSLRAHSNGQAILSAGYAGYAPVRLPDDRDPPAAMAIQ